MPLVSIIVPCYNEEATICWLLEAILNQSYPRSQMEVVVADGLSTDRTRAQIEAFCGEHPDLNVQVVDNPKRNIPAGVNRAVSAACGEYILRLDAHSMPYPDYVARCAAALDAGLGANIGGVWEIRPADEGWQARSIAVAAAHPLGVGDARYRLGGEAQAVETVPFGAFRRSLFVQLGGFDERLLSNEDYEFNVRVRNSGGVVWHDPQIRSTYIARRSLVDLWRQYWRYGYWKAQMLKRNPRTLRWRHLAGLFVLSFVFLAVLGIWLPLARLALGIEVATYLLALMVAGGQVAVKKRDLAYLAGVPLAIGTMHFAWGTAFIWSMMTRKA